MNRFTVILILLATSALGGTMYSAESIHLQETWRLCNNPAMDPFMRNSLAKYLEGGTYEDFKHLIERLSGKDQTGESQLSRIIDLPAAEEKTLLYRAVELRKEEACKLLVEYGASINKVCIGGSTALHKAVEMGLEKMVQVMLQHGADICAQDDRGATPLHRAIEAGHLGCAQLILNGVYSEETSPINIADKNGDMPLHRASKKGVRDFMELCVYHGSLVNAKNKNGQFPYHLAAQTDSFAACEFLNDLSYEKYSPDNHNRTALHWAAYRGALGSAIGLLQQVSWINSADNKGRTPLHLAAATGKQDLITKLLDKGATIDSRDNDGRTPLSLAAGHDQIGCMEVLIRRGANWESQDKKHNRPLHRAAGAGKAAAVTHLLDAGAEKNPINKKGMTPSHLAAQAGSIGCLRALQDHQADSEAADLRGNRPLYLAALNGHVRLVKKLFRDQRDRLDRVQKDLLTTGLVEAIKNNNVAAIRALIAAGADVHYKGADGRTLLHCAVDHGALKSFDELIEVGLSLDAVDLHGSTPFHDIAMKGLIGFLPVLEGRKLIAKKTEQEGWTLLHCAVVGDQESFIQALGDYNIAWNEVDKQSRTALRLAVELESIKCLKKLLSKPSVGREIHDDKGDTPLFAAVRLMKSRAVRLLADYRVACEMLDTDGLSPLHRAVLQSDEESIRALLSNDLYKGVLLEKRSRGCKTPLMLADVLADDKVIALLIELGADVGGIAYPLHWAAEKGYCLSIVALVNRGMKVDLQDAKERTPLHLAALHDQADAVSVLLVLDANRKLGDATRQTPLHYAASVGSGTCVELLYDISDNGQYVDREGRTALHCAAQHGQRDCADRLIKLGADIQARDGIGKTPLHLAAKHGQLGCIELLLEKKAPKDFEDSESQTPVFEAIESEALEAIKLLVRAGCNLEAKNRKSMRPLHWAVYGNHIEAVKVLREFKLATRFLDDMERTPLHLAAQLGHTLCAKHLLANDPDVGKQKDRNGATALHDAATYGHEDCVSLLIDNRVDINAQDKDGFTPLHCATKNHRLGVIRLLLLAEVSMDLSDRDGNLPIHLATIEGFEEGLKLLLQAASSVADKNKADKTPKDLVGEQIRCAALLAEYSSFDTVDQRLRYCFSDAAARGDVELLKLLSKTAKTVKGCTLDSMDALNQAAEGGHVSSVSFLVKEFHGKHLRYMGKDSYVSSPLHKAAKKGHSAVVDALIGERKTDSNILDPDGRSPLFHAAENGYLSCVEVLLYRGALPNIIDKNKKTALYYAAKKGQVACVEALLNARADQNAVSEEDGWTPLHAACLPSGNCETVQCLLNNKANVDVQNHRGATPLHIAVQGDNEMLVRKLLVAGAKTNVADGNECTPLHYAARQGKGNFVRLLVEYGAQKQIENNERKTALKLAEENGDAVCIELLS